LTPVAYRRICLVALWLVAGIIVTGAGVRVSGSGLGCPDWPVCQHGSLIPKSGWHGWVESTNRYFTGAISVVVALCVLGSLARVPRRRDLTWLSLGLVAGVFAQAVLGGISVLLKLNPVTVAGHYLLSIVLLVDGVVLYQRAGWPDDATPRTWRRGYRRVAGSLAALCSLVLLLGTAVTGAGPHSGDEKAHRFGWTVRAAVRIHGGAVWTFLVAFLATVWWLHRRGDRERHDDRITAVLICIIGQGTLGYIQYFAGVPAALALAHVFGSVLVALSTLWFLLHLADDPVANGADSTVTEPTSDAAQDGGPWIPNPPSTIGSATH
jgi:cytochrome c oxidase assembly protein subunit 15